MADRIERSIELKAPISRVWQALTDHKQFGTWFRVNLDGPFIAGKLSTGQITYPGYEHIKWEAIVQKIEPEHYFSFSWHPYAIDPKIDYSHEPKTLIEFKLQEMPSGTVITVVESGFENIPESRRFEAFRMNDNGWAMQLANIEHYVKQNA